MVVIISYYIVIFLFVYYISLYLWTHVQFLARDSIICLVRFTSSYAIARPSVRHTSGSVRTVEVNATLILR